MKIKERVVAVSVTAKIGFPFSGQTNSPKVAAAAEGSLCCTGESSPHRAREWGTPEWAPREEMIEPSNVPRS